LSYGPSVKNGHFTVITRYVQH